ncbi:MAG: hypothetical protein Q7T49_01320 [bacterium]|nr:hypothetical protein [bacterium]
MKFTKNQLIIGLVVLLIIIGGYWFFNRSNTSLTSTTLTSPGSSNSFFPLTAVKNIISTVTNNLTSSTTEVINGLFDEEDKPANFDILRAHKLVGGPVGEFGFTNKTGSTTLFYTNQNSNIISFIPEGASTTKIDLLLTPSSVIKSPDNSQFITLKTTPEGLVGELTSVKSKLTTKVLTSPLTDWLISWPEANTLNLQTRPSSGIDGFAYTFNLRTKQTTKILGPITGLNSLISPDGKKVIYSSSQNGKIETYVKTNSKEVGDKLSINTLIDKCLWYNNKYIVCMVTDKYLTTNYPDAWYQGLVSFTDNVWLVDSQYLESYLISIFGKPLADEPIDAINLKISPDKSTLYFINKLDRSLWSFDLTHAF